MKIKTTLACSAALALVTAGSAVTAASAGTNGPSGGPGGSGSPGVPIVREGICTAPVTYKALAARLSRDIRAALAPAYDTYGLTVYDRPRDVTCALNEGAHFHSASVVKATILAALLLWHQETGRPLTSTENYLATIMITLSDNNAATALWDELGYGRLQHFLDVAGMTETRLGLYGYWGDTDITAHDELTLLRLLTKPNAVLSDYSRNYELGLMANVVSWERWGVSAGAPRGVTVHIKNGWLPESPGGWHINSIGAFTGHGRDYMMAVLTDNNPSEQYGIDTIQGAAEVVNRDLNAGLAPAGLPLPAVAVVPSKLPADSAGGPRTPAAPWRPQAPRTPGAPPMPEA